jgi:hypothetical protein
MLRSSNFSEIVLVKRITISEDVLVLRPLRTTITLPPPLIFRVTVPYVLNIKQ